MAIGNRIRMKTPDLNLLFASLIWGAIGSGYALYGRRQKSLVPFVGGVVMVVASGFAGSITGMSAVCLGAMAGVFWLVRKGY
jgi:hypothetical protein